MRRRPPFLLLLLLAVGTAAQAEGVDVERLTWAGVKLVAGDTTVLVDAVGRDLWDGNAPEGLVPVTSDTRRTYALVTHAHGDHFDPDTLAEVLGERGWVIAPEAEAHYVAARGLRVIPARLWEPVFRGGFSFMAVPAVDGFGDVQVSWVIRHGDVRVLHGGDTLWHGGFANVGRHYGPFDVAFLPINGVVPGSETRTTAAVLTPEQAVDAARDLDADLLVPIHFGDDAPPGYDEVDDPLGGLREAAAERGQRVRHLTPGQELALPARAEAVVAVDLMRTRPGEQVDYLRFIELNWATARETAVARGAVRDFEVLSREPDGESWDVMLRTTYVDEAAWAAREEIFAEIFEARGPATLIDGKGPRDMAEFLDDGRDARRTITHR
jgi:L-ascorbate metabolism protein UlaG (beta-lactamase superfamily)